MIMFCPLVTLIFKECVKIVDQVGVVISSAHVRVSESNRQLHSTYDFIREKKHKTEHLGRIYSELFKNLIATCFYQQEII